MENNELKKSIINAINNFATNNLTKSGLKLFNILGYNTERSAHLEICDYKNFYDTYIYNNANFNENKAIVEDWKYIDLLFQLSKYEMSNHNDLFSTDRVDNTIIESYFSFV